MKYPQILYEDNHIIVVVKPANLPVQADISGDIDMLTLLKAYIKEKYNKPGNVYLGLVHRLDRPVGGVMVFAKTSKAASRLSESFAKKDTSKHYAAVVCGRAQLSCRLECYMKKDEKTFSSFICDKKTEGAKAASLHYMRCAYKGGLSLVDVDLKTGRHHQIRLQLSGEGLPIYGDHRYNSRFFNDTATDIALFAYSLSFPHPTTHDMLCFTALPNGGVWQSFEKELCCLKDGVHLVYNDKNIIVCNKQTGVTVAVADGDENSLESRLNRHFTFAKPVHRIDATTEGLVVFAANETALSCLLQAFAAKTGSVSKEYICTVVGKPQNKEKTLTAYLKKDDKAGMVYVSPTNTAGSKEIITKYSVVKSYVCEGVMLSQLKIRLVTGRTHQIRAHMAFEGYPLAGDDKYGNREINKRLKLKTPQLLSACIGFCFGSESPLCYLNDVQIN